MADDPTPAPDARRSGLPAEWRWALVILYMATIFALSSLSSLSMPVRFSDKAVHAGAYAVLSGLIVWALVAGDFTRVRLRVVVLAVAASVVYGWSDETHQLFVPGRMYEWLDLAADTAGAVAAACGLWAWGIIARGSSQDHGV